MTSLMMSQCDLKIFHTLAQDKLVVEDGKNIERHTAHTIVPRPNHKQWQMGYISDLMMIIR